MERSETEAEERYYAMLDDTPIATQLKPGNPRQTPGRFTLYLIRIIKCRGQNTQATLFKLA